MKLLSFSSQKVNKVLESDGIDIVRIAELGLIETIYYKEEIINELKIKKFNTTLEDIDINCDAVVFDYLSVLQNYYVHKLKVLSEETINYIFPKEVWYIVKRHKIEEELIDIFKESLKIIINKLMKFYTPNQIILLKIKFDEDCPENIRFNNLLEKFYNVTERIIKGHITIDLLVESVDKIDKLVNGKILNKIQNELEAKVIFKKEKIHRSINNIRYVFEKSKIHNKDKLIIIFSAFSIDIPKYNYVSFFKTIDCNKLFILDDYGEKGSYYLGVDGGLEIETSVMSLINKIIAENDFMMKDIIAVGSSKGGSAALYYGYKYSFGNVIAGAPQYKIGSYLIDLTIKDYAKEIFGNLNLSSRIKYDSLIRLVLGNGITKARILTSDGDNQYERVLKQLEVENQQEGYNIIFDKCDIESHGEIARVFPEYLEKNLAEILGGKGLYGNSPIFKIIKGIKRRGE